MRNYNNGDVRIIINSWGVFDDSKFNIITFLCLLYEVGKCPLLQALIVYI